MYPSSCFPFATRTNPHVVGCVSFEIFDLVRPDADFHHYYYTGKPKSINIVFVRSLQPTPLSLTTTSPLRDLQHLCSVCASSLLFFQTSARKTLLQIYLFFSLHIAQTHKYNIISSPNNPDFFLFLLSFIIINNYYKSYF